MRRDHAIQLIRAHKAELAQFAVRSLQLFGSVARDEARPDSDVDVLVEFEGDPTFLRYMRLVGFLEDLLGTRVDLLTPDSIKPRARTLMEKDLIRVT